MPKINGQGYWLWLAYEPNLHICMFAISIYLGKEPSLYYVISSSKRLEHDSEINQSILMELIGITMMFADGWLRLKHIVYRIELKNIMERFIQHIEDRTECFDDNFPCKEKL